MLEYLVDTNVLVYAIDERDSRNRERAARWLEHLADAGSAALSTQALTELANVCLNRIQPRWSPQEVTDHLWALSRAFEVVPVTPGVVMEAVRGVEQYGLSFFDAQMWAVAKLKEIPILLSQDLATGSTIEGVTFVDPFTTEAPGP